MRYVSPRASRMVNFGVMPGVGAAGDVPHPGRRTVDLVRAADHFVDRHVVAAEAVREPAGVGHLAQRVDVQRRTARLHRVAERLAHELVALREVELRDRRNVARVSVAPDRIVGIEAFRLLFVHDSSCCASRRAPRRARRRARRADARAPARGEANGR